MITPKNKATPPPRYLSEARGFRVSGNLAVHEQINPLK